MTNAELRTQRLAELAALKGTNLLPTQLSAIETMEDAINEEAGASNADTMPQHESCAYTLPYQLRTALESLPATTSALTKAGVVGTPLSYQIVGTNDPESYSAAPLPAGLTLDEETGLISGTPTGAGTTNTVINAINQRGTSPNRTLVFTIAAS